MDTAERPVLPRPALIALGALLALTIAGAGAWRAADLPTREPDAAVSQMRLLRFEDRPAGGVAVIDAKTGAVIETMHGEQGFLRGTLRTFSRERKRRDLGSEAAFELTARADGRTSLSDPTTGHRVDLDSFGPSNAAVFTRFFEAGVQKP